MLFVQFVELVKFVKLVELVNFVKSVKLVELVKSVELVKLEFKSGLLECTNSCAGGNIVV